VSERWVPLDLEATLEDPFAQFRRWFDEATGEMLDRDTVALVTVSADARPSARMVLMRHVSDTSFGWYSNYSSRKGRDLDENPHAALLWYCEPLGRQVRIEGAVRHMTPAASDAYFATRPRGSQLGAHASAQSSPLSSREELEERLALVSQRFEGREVPRPENWGGFELVPDYFEFWQHRQDRLHDRIAYRPADGTWRRERLAP
jgi:pyridoxamine 5'-phosphate oxidase